MKIGRRLRGNEAIELAGDLGTGKTAFVRGLAKGMDAQDDVSSPSFTISNRYRGPKITLYHFDFHRLDNPGIMRRELAEVLDDPRAAVVVEWADTVQDVIPENRLKVAITATGETNRQFTIYCPGELNYLVPEGPA